MNLFGKCR